eukprot:g4199.t1
MASREDRAVLEGYGAILLDLVSSHATQRQWSEWLKVPLELCLRRGDSDLVSRLLVAGSVAREGSRGKDGHPLLLAAIAERDHDKVAPEQGASGGTGSGSCADGSSLQSEVAKARTRQERSALLHDAIRRGDGDIVSGLLERGADVDMPDSDGRSPLRAAVSGCSLAVVRVLLNHGAGVSAVLLGGHNGMPSLVKAAARKEEPGILKALAAHGADVDAMDSGNYTALHHAAMLGNSGSIDALVEAGADVRATNPDNGCTALHWAAKKGHCEAMITLLRHGADVDAADYDGRTPLHRACSVDDLHATEAAELLLIWGADDTAINKNGHTAEDYVRRREESDVGTADRGMLTRLLRTLASSPADRAWCRHGLVVLCKARLGQEGVGTILDRLVTMAEEELFESSWGSRKGSRSKHRRTRSSK